MLPENGGASVPDVMLAKIEPVYPDASDLHGFANLSCIEIESE